MKPNQLNPNRQIVISNALNESRFRMSRAEQKLFLYCIGNINNVEKDLYETIEFDMVEFGKYLELNTTRLYSDFKKLTFDLVSRVVEIDIGLAKCIQLNIISRVEYDSGRVKIDINPKIAPYLIELKNNFTRYSLKEVLKFRSVYSIRIFQILSQYSKLKTVTLEVKKLRFMLDIGVNEYKFYADFKRKVLETALKEINKNSALSFAYQEIKTGKKVTSIKFVIKKFEVPKIEFIQEDITKSQEYQDLTAEKETQPAEEVKEVEILDKTFTMIKEEEPTPQALPPVYSRLTALGYSSINATKILNENTTEYLEFVFEKSKIEERDKVTNKAGYFGTLIVQYREIYQDELERLKIEEERAKEYEESRERYEQEKKESEERFKQEQPNIARAILEEEPELFTKYIYLYMKRMIVDTQAGFTYHPDWIKNNSTNDYETNKTIARAIHKQFLECRDLREFRNLIKYDHEWLFKAVCNDSRELDPESQDYYKKDYFVKNMDIPFKI